jgi:glycosyltransferase involved in cell wall biosynthesis
MGIPRYLVFARLGGYYKLKYYKSTDYFIGITPDICRYVQDYVIEPERVRHINNFADVEAVERSIDRAEFGTPANATLLLGLGRLHTSKGFDVLIKAVLELDGVYLWIAGEGHERGALEALIAQSGCGARVKLLGWRSDRAALFEACDICAFVSRTEPFGTVFVQAWALKVPVIVSSADGPRQFVRDGEDGLVVAIEDKNGLKTAILKLIDDAQLSDKIVKNGFERYEAEFTKTQSVQNYLSFYRDMSA